MNQRLLLISLLTAALSGTFTANAEFEVPEAEIIVPIGGKAELLNNMISVTWGYYGIVDNAGNEPMSATLTFPDGTVKTVNGEITSVNREGEIEGEVPTTEDNALMFRNFMSLDPESMTYIQQYGIYNIVIPEGIVLVNGVPNPGADLSFEITGVLPEAEKMEPGTLVYPSSYFSSFLSLAELSWPGQAIEFVNNADSVNIDVLIDGNPTSSAKATIQTLVESGPDDADEYSFDALVIMLDDIISYMDGLIVDIEIPEGILQNEKGEVNPGQTLTFTLLETVDGTATPASGATLSSDSANVVVNWPGLSVVPNDGEVIARAYKNDNADDIVLTPEFSTDSASITINLSGLGEGSFEIIIPEAYLLVLTEENNAGDTYSMNEAMVLNYTITDESGVYGLITDENTFRVYSLDGVKLFDDSGADDLSNLKKGIYIVNGKRVLIGK